MSNFTASVGSTLDVVSFHTYDYETRDLGLKDHHSVKVRLKPFARSPSPDSLARPLQIPFTPHCRTQPLQNTPDIDRFWNTTYLDFAARLLGNVTAIASQSAPAAQVWLTETDSICHQGVNGLTNAYLNR